MAEHEARQHIGVALSGGGHRASVWAAGALLYLADAGKTREVAAVSSVSGGSITNGVLAHELDLAQADVGDVDSALRPLVRHVAQEGLFPLARATRAYVLAVLALAGLGLLALVAGLVAMAARGLRGEAALLLLAAVGLLAAAAWQLTRRSAVVDRAMARTHFSRGGAPTRLADVGRSVDHVLCATELQSGDHVYLSPRFVYGHQFGVGAPGRLRLSTAVQASACLPGAFNARTLRAGDVYAEPREGREVLVLTDGGVYDNMADQWLTGLAARLARQPGLPAVARDVDEVVVVNASAPVAWQPHRRARLWLLREVGTLLRVNSVMYQVTTERRREALIDAWSTAERLHEGQRGALVHIAQSPYRVAGAFARGDDDRAERARAVLALLGDDDVSRGRWESTAGAARAVPTVLSRLERGVCETLLEHAYVLAMCNLHVVLGYPLLDLPGTARFATLFDTAAPVDLPAPRAGVDASAGRQARA